MLLYDIGMTALYFVCSAYGVYRGYHKLFIGIAFLLAVIFQYVLDFSLVAEIVIAAIFIYYFVFSNRKKSPASSQSETVFSRAENTRRDEEDIEAVFQEFQNFTRGNKSGQSKQQRSRQ